MQCPACGNELLPETLNNTTYHVCDGACGGVWFERLELEKCDDTSTYLGDPLTIPKGDCPSLNQSKRYTCPSCENIIMKRRYLDAIEDVMTDECPSCGGFWLNGDDLEEMHSQMDAPGLNSTDQIDKTDAHTQSREKRLIAMCHGLCPGQPVG